MCDSKNNHDDLLFNMLKECTTLPLFLDEIFGFLQRRTDFYHIAKEPNSPVGLPEGLAEKLVKHSFYKNKPKPQNIPHGPQPFIINDKEIPIVAEETVVSEETLLSEEKDCIKRVSIVENKNYNENYSVFTKSESYNGAVYDNYSWSQSILDVDIIIVKLPENVSSKDLQVTILSNKICVKIKDTTVLEGELCQKCKYNDAIWSLDKNKLEIHLEKCKEMWWDCLLMSEPKLDLSQIDCSRPFEDLPEEAQAKIEELQWNQERKRLGLPTSEDISREEILKRAWNAEGSPFKGRPFDPKSVVFE